MSHVSPQNPGLLNWLYISAVGIIWGSAFMSTRLALDGFGPWTVAAGRVSIAALALILIGFASGQGINKIKGIRAWSFVFAYSIISVAFALSILSWGQQYVTSAFAGVAMGIGPLLVLPLAAVFSQDEGIGPKRIAGVVLGFIGLCVLIGPTAFSSSGKTLEFWGQLACIGTASGYAIGSLITRRAPKMPPLAFAAASLALGSLFLLPLMYFIEGLPEFTSESAAYALLYAALIPTALAAVIRVRVITTAGSVFMSLTSYMVPIWSVLFGATLMGEILPKQLFFGLALILAGIALSQMRNWRRKPPT